MPDDSLNKRVAIPAALYDALVRVAFKAHHYRTAFFVAFIGNVVQCATTFF